MTRSRPILIAIVLALVASLAGLAGAWALGYPRGKLDNPAILNMSFPAYEEQKVVYHVTFSGGFRNRAYRNLLSVASNHMDAVGDAWIDIRIVLQGDGLDLLIAAKSDPDFAQKIDALKKRGARFTVCWNTVTARGLDPDKTMHGVRHADLVQSSMAEVAKLLHQGYVYLKL
jgi:intracellular sulfur oxidation DsrE/DsrF family protein